MGKNMITLTPAALHQFINTGTILWPSPMKPQPEDHWGPEQVKEWIEGKCVRCGGTGELDQSDEESHTKYCDECGGTGESDECKLPYRSDDQVEIGCDRPNSWGTIFSPLSGVIGVVEGKRARDITGFEWADTGWTLQQSDPAKKMSPPEYAWTQTCPTHSFGNTWVWLVEFNFGEKQ